MARPDDPTRAALSAVRARAVRARWSAGPLPERIACLRCGIAEAKGIRAYARLTHQHPAAAVSEALRFFLDHQHNNQGGQHGRNN